MTPASNRRSVIVGGLILFLILAGGLWVWLTSEPEPEPIEPELVPEMVEEPVMTQQEVVIGQSVEGRTISAVTFGSGEQKILFVGGIHGGYEWNSVLLAYDMIDELTAKPELVPSDVSVTIIPSLNPDGVAAVVGKDGRFLATEVPTTVDQSIGRFNANDVDLNRNFDCNWAPESTWRGNVVSAGTSAFSEPEAAALRDWVLNNNPKAVVFWHSQANAVYGSECNDGVLPATLAVMNTYAEAAGYNAVPVFDAYKVTGDAEGWLASIGIPAVTVELATHESIEWTKNIAGTLAVIKSYSDTELAR